MIEITISKPRRTITVAGHMEDARACGALTMLLRASGLLAQRIISQPGMTFLEFGEDFDCDYAALVFGIECITHRVSDDVKYIYPEYRIEIDDQTL